MAGGELEHPAAGLKEGTRRVISRKERAGLNQSVTCKRIKFCAPDRN